MNKKDKSTVDSEWSSVAGNSAKHGCSCSDENKKKKAVDNQWTSK